MRTLLGVVAFLVAGIAAAQEPQTPSAGKFYGPLAPKPSPSAPQPPLNLNLASAQEGELSPTYRLTAKTCAVPLIQMKSPTATDAISAGTPQVNDPMRTKPPAPACSE